MEINLTNVHFTKRTKSKSKCWKSYEKNISPSIKKMLLPSFCSLLLFAGVFLRLQSNNGVEGSKMPPNANLPPISISFLFSCNPLLSPHRQQRKTNAEAKEQSCKEKYASANNNRYWKAKMLKILTGQHTRTYTSHTFPTCRIRAPWGNHQTAKL